MAPHALWRTALRMPGHTLDLGGASFPREVRPHLHWSASSQCGWRTGFQFLILGTCLLFIL